MDDKEIIATHNSIILTENSIVQEYEGLGYKEFIEIPLKKINSIKCSRALNVYMLILGSSLIFLGLWNLFNNDLAKYGFIVCGLAAILSSLLTRKHFIEFSSTKISITENSKNSENFLREVRKQLYKKN